MKFVVVLLFVIAISITAFYFIPKSEEKETTSHSDQLRTPEEELAGFKLADGFVVELVASEKDGIINPIDLTFDDAGRLWTQTAQMYPLDPIPEAEWDDLLKLMEDPNEQKNHPNFRRILDLYQGKTKGIDKILVLSGLYEGKKVNTTVWADSLAIPMSILPYKNGAYVAQGSELFFLDDSDKDGKADERVPLLTGFGFVDTHTMAHVLIRGPADWIYFSHGALNKGTVTSLTSNTKVNINYSKIGRFSLDAKKVGLVSAGLNNIWGFQLRNAGQWYGTEANDLGFSVVPMEPGTGFSGIGNDRLHMYQPFVPELHKFRVGGTGISGLAFADDASGSFPSAWKDVALLANPITSTINAVSIVRNPDGTVTAKHLSDLLTSDDKYFRPVNMEFGPDGCLYVADWYDKIISHNEVPRTDPNRDKKHGRIWRIRHVSQKAYPIPDFYTVKTTDLVNYLKSPSLWMKRAAWHQITDRPADQTKSLAPAIIALAGDKMQDPVTRIHALWSLEGIKHYDNTLMEDLLASDDHDLRREAIRSLESFSLAAPEIANAVQNLVEDANPMVRSQVLRTIAESGLADTSTIDILVRACKPELSGHEMGGAYERKFERYLALKALEQYPKELQAYLNTKMATNVAPANLIWAIQALPNELKEKKFIELWPLAKIEELDESTFIMISKMLRNKNVYSLVKPLFESDAHAVKYLNIALTNEQQVQSAALSRLLETPARHLLSSSSEADRLLALEAVGNLNITTLQGTVASLVNDRASADVLKMALKALDDDPRAHKEQFLFILNNEKFDLDIRLSALNSLAKADAAAALQNAERWIAKFNSEQKKAFVDLLSGSKEGSAILLTLYGRQQIDIDAFDPSSAERVYNAHLNKSVAKEIAEAAQMKAEEDRKAFNNKFEKYMSIVQKKEGNVSRGKVIFETTCLLCHRVGDKGQSIAPALDGSSSRSNEALLTAILNPDVAVEGGYAVYRVIKNDNSTLEGYLSSKDERGTTLSFMGGSKVFIAASEIKSQGHLPGRSFMPKGLIDNFTESQVADLFSYINSLK